MALSSYHMIGQDVTLGELYTQASFDAHGINTALPVGATAATADITQGSSSYVIPIQLPAGTNSVVPEMSVYYSSNASDGHMGIGWNLSGISMVSRAPKTIYHDNETRAVQLDAEDPLMLDGSRLIQNTSNTYVKEMYDYSTITAHGSYGSKAQWYSMETKYGVVMEFGREFNSTLKNEDNSEIIYWKLSKVKYKDGNYIEYHYEQNGRDHRLKEIKYTGNEIAGLAPYNSVQISYLGRGDKSISTYEAESKIELNSLVDKITIYASGSLFKEYRMSYATDDVLIFLKSITEVGADGTSQLNPTIFKYGEVSDEYTYSTFDTQFAPGTDIYTGDFNGDGHSDKVVSKYETQNGNNYTNSYRLYTKIPNPNNDNFGFKFEENLPGVGDYTIGNIYNTFSNDYTGEGRDDLAFLMSFSVSFNGNTFRLFNSVKLHEMGDNAASINIVDIPLPVNNYNTFMDGDKALSSGDFNGDGIMDMLLVLGDDIVNNDYVAQYAAFVYYGNISTQFEQVTLTGNSTLTIEDWGTKYIHTVDMNGDGKNEILVAKGAQSEVFSFDGTTATSTNGSAMGYPTEWHLIYLGDFNGDRKTDILTRGGLNDNNASWYTGRSNGSIFIEDTNEIPWISNYPDVNEDYMGDFIICGDYNGDGKSDIARTLSFTGTFNVQFYYSLGNTFEFTNAINPDNNELNTYNTPDFNGDGKAEFINRYVSGSNTISKVLKIQPNAKNLYLHRIKNGHGHITTFNYETMSNTPYYLRNSMTVQPVNTVEVPMVLAMSIYQSGREGTSYQYSNAKLHKTGKGFLGFEKIEKRSNNGTNIREITHYELNTDHMVMAPVMVETIDGMTPIMTRNITNEYVAQTGGVDPLQYYSHRVTATQDINHLEGTTTNTTSQYDANGNVDYTSMDINGIETRVTNATFGIYGTPIPALPLTSTTTISRAGASAHTVAEAYTYNSLGQVLTKTIYPGQDKEIKETYTYNNLGNKETLSISAPNEQDRTTSTIFDPKGVHIVSSTNTLGQSSSAVYSYLWSKPTSTTGIDGLSTNYTYDAFGRLETTTYPQGYTVSNSYHWATGTGVHRMTQTHPGMPDVTSYYDILDREIQKDIAGYGLTKTSTVQYDQRGNVHITTSPTGFTTTNTYDDYNRPLTISDDFGTTSMTYSYSGGNLITTTTNAANQVSSTTTDATQKVISSTDYGGTLSYTYHSTGDLKSTTMNGTTLVSTQIDAYGRQTSLTDVNAGTTAYVYDAFGQLTSETSAKGETTNMTYNKLGQMLTRVGPEGTTTHSYYPSGSGASTNQLQTLTSFGGDVQTYSYDTYGRAITHSHLIDGTSYTRSSTYDSYGNMLTHTYPSGLMLKYNYDADSYLTSITNINETETIYELVSMNALDQQTNYRSTIGGQTQTSTWAYHHGIPTLINNSDKTGHEYTWDYASGNLSMRKQRTILGASSWVTEEFGYDNLNRLITFGKQGQTPRSINYNANGNINTKADVGGAYSYDPNKIHAVNGVANADFTQLSMYNQDISYNSFMQPSLITEKNYQQSYTYGVDHQRLKGTLTRPDGSIDTRLYLGDYEVYTSNGVQHKLHYINIGKGLHMVIERQGATDTYYRCYTDYQGSLMYIGNASTEHHYQYDPWGRRWEAQTHNYQYTHTAPTWLSRGYTGHEHLDDFQLINMNGRLYDPHLGRMLSPDNNIQLPHYSQNYNRYSYVLNNPLRFTDPSGEFIVSGLIGAGIAVLANGIGNWINDRPFFQGALKSAAFGAVSGIISAGIGSVAAQATTAGKSKLTVALGQAFLHGYTALAVGIVSGSDNPIASFPAGALSSLTAGAAQSLGSGTIPTLVTGGLSGGIGARLTGGDFWDGVQQGLITSGLNHVAHSVSFKGPGDPPTKEELKVYLAGKFLEGSLSKQEYINAISLIDDGTWGLLQQVVQNNKFELAMTVIPVGRLGMLGRYFASLEQLGQSGRIIANVVRDAPRLSARYGGPIDGWRKMTSTLYTGKDGFKFSTHWYQNTRTGLKVEHKTVFGR